MFSFLKPTYYAETVYDIDFQKLYDSGINFIIFDIDNTLISYDEIVPNENNIKLFNKLNRMGFVITILSNGHSDRAMNFAKSLNIGFIGDAFKPSRRGYSEIEKNYKVKMKDSVMIGDQIFTDIWGANRAGCVSVLLKPIKLSNEPGFVKFKRLIEKIIIKTVTKETKKF